MSTQKSVGDEVKVSQETFTVLELVRDFEEDFD